VSSPKGGFPEPLSPDFHQDATGGVMLKIELPYINANKLMKRWNMGFVDLIRCILDYDLPVYDINYKKQEIVPPKSIDYPNGPINGISGYIRYENTLSEIFEVFLALPAHYRDIRGEMRDKILSDFYFKMEEVKRFEAKYGEKYALPVCGKNTIETVDQDIPSAPRRDKITKTNAEDFIRNLRVSYENNSEVKIKEPNRIGKTFNHESLGFSSNKTKEWKAFINVFQDSPHIYETGQAHSFSDALKKKICNPEYGRLQKRLKIINSKLIKFFNKEYRIHLPEDFKLYELCKGEGC